MQSKINTVQWQSPGLRQGGTSLPLATAPVTVKKSFASVLAGSSRREPDRATAAETSNKAIQPPARREADRGSVQHHGNARKADRHEPTASRTQASADSTAPRAAAVANDRTSNHPVSAETLPSKFDEMGAAVAELAELADDGKPVDVAAFGEWLDENAGLFGELADLFDMLDSDELVELGLTPELQSLLQSLTSVFQQFDSLVAAHPEASNVDELLASSGLTMIDGQPLTMAQLTGPLKSLAETLGGLAQQASQPLQATGGQQQAVDQQTSQSDQKSSELNQGALTDTQTTKDVAPSREQALFAKMLSADTNPDDKIAINNAPLVSSLPAGAVVSGAAPGQPANATDGRVSLPFQTTLAGSVSDSAEWQEQFQQKLSWFLKEGIRSARLQLNPSDMGPIDVRIQISKEQTNIQIFAQNPQVREMMEGSAQRLRELLSSQNLDLGSFDVSSQGRDGSSGQGARGEAENGQLAGAGNESNSELANDTSASAQEVLLGSQNIRLVDHYV